LGVLAASFEGILETGPTPFGGLVQPCSCNRHIRRVEYVSPECGAMRCAWASSDVAQDQAELSCDALEHS
jgi:hypothetical protein